MEPWEYLGQLKPRAGCRAWMPTLEFCGFSPEMPHHRLKLLLDHSDIPQELSVEGLFPDPVPVQRCVFGGVIGSGADFMDGQLIPMMGSCCDGRFAAGPAGIRPGLPHPGWFRESHLTPRELQLLEMYHRPNVLHRAEGEVKGQRPAPGAHK